MSNVTVVKVVKIGGKTYKTADKAAKAWAEQAFWNAHQRHTDKIGHAAYHDAAWEARNGAQSKHDEDLTSAGFPGIVMNFGMNKLEAKAYRRSLPIFQAILGK